MSHKVIADRSCSTGIVQSSTGSNYVVRILSTLDREKLKPSSSVALHRHSNALVDILPPEADSSIAMLGEDEKPDVTYADVGGMDMQKQEIREAVELPLTHFDLYRQIGALNWIGKMVNDSDEHVTDWWIRYRSSSWCPAVRSPGYRKNYVGQGCGQQHNRQLHSSKRFGIRSEILG